MVRPGLDFASELALKSVDAAWEEPARSVIAKGAAFPVSKAVAAGLPKLFSDCVGGVIMVVKALPKGQKCSQTWAALAIVCDYRGRIAVRAYKGSEMTNICKFSRIDMSVEAQLALSGGGDVDAVDLCDMARTAAVRAVGAARDGVAETASEQMPVARV